MKLKLQLTLKYQKGQDLGHLYVAIQSGKATNEVLDQSFRYGAGSNLQNQVSARRQPALRVSQQVSSSGAILIRISAMIVVAYAYFSDGLETFRSRKAMT